MTPDTVRRFSNLAILIGALAVPMGAAPAAAEGILHDPREVQLAEVRQLTFGGENAEAYWSPDGDELILQSTVPPFDCDQIYRLDPDHPGERTLVSTGDGRTTCAYFTADGERILYATTHFFDDACPPPPDRSQGYVWALYDSFEIVTARPDGSDVVRLTDNRFYDAEATVCPVDGSIVFTSDRDGDLELYRMNADGSEVTRLTETPGYDGGAFFSADCSQIVWRASRPREGEELEDYQRLLDTGLIRPGRLELWVADADGGNPRQVTYLGAASFAPYFFPDGDRILFSSNYGDPQGREFDLWAVDVDGTDLERITYTPGFDGFPMFSPDGTRLAFSSNRNQGKPGETDVYVARWVGREPPAVESPADRLEEEVAWLAADERDGRGVGTEGLEEAGRWLAARLAEIGLEPAAGAGLEGEGGSAATFHQPFEVPVRVAAGPGTALRVDGEAVAEGEYVIASFATTGTAAGEVVPVGYGISAPELGHDDYDGIDVEGRIALVRRYTPAEGFEESSDRRRYGDLRYKAWNAREHGAAGVLIVDLPVVEDGAETPAESPLPSLRIETRADAGLPVMVVTRKVGAPLFAGSHTAELEVVLETREEPAKNVVARLPAGGDRLPGTLLVGAHYDHLGFGGPGSLDPDAEAPHNGADDNASGTAALLEIARRLESRRDELRRDVYVVAFSGEESGLRGSTHLTRNPPPGLAIDELVAMVNLDMVGRLRHNRVAVLGAASAAEWGEILPPLCRRVEVGCKLGGDGYGPSDQTPFYAAGVPVLHFFTGTHTDYHRPSDDAHKLNVAGLARVSGLVADLLVELSNRPEPLTYEAAPAPEPQGDQRSYGASLGTIPEYADEGPGVLLSGTRPEGPADRAGMRRGDRLVELAGHEVRDIYDFMYVLRQSKPGETTTAVVERDGERVELEVTFGQSRGIR